MHKLKALGLILLFLTSAADAKVLVLVDELQPIPGRGGVVLHDITSVIQRFRENQIEADFATPSGSAITIDGHLDYGYVDPLLRKADLDVFESGWGMPSFNSYNCSNENLNLIKSALSDATAKQVPYRAPLSLKKLVTGEGLSNYKALIVLAGQEAVFNFSTNSSVKILMNHFHSNNLTTAVLGYGIVALNVKDESQNSIYYGYQIAACAPLDNILVTNGLVVMSKDCHEQNVISDREVISGQQSASIEKLLDVFVASVLL